MKFNKHLSKELQEHLENQHNEYCKVTKMASTERAALREWVKDGNSVYDNPSGAWYDGQVPVEFLTIYRDEEYIRQATKDMSSEHARKFALDYYGWSDDSDDSVTTPVYDTETDDICFQYSVSISDEELPFK